MEISRSLEILHVFVVGALVEPSIMSVAPYCGCSAGVMEIYLHILRDCHEASIVWKAFFYPSHVWSFFAKVDVVRLLDWNLVQI